MNNSKLPTSKTKASELFGFTTDLTVTRFEEKTEHVPELNPHYHFDPDTTLAILAGFEHNKRVLVQGYHGTGKSSHIEQIAARLNWPCIRINLDGYISRIDLIGKDAIVLQDGKQITEFKPGILPWAIERPVALVFDEYDAARPEVMFILQRLLEEDGKFTLLDQNKVLTPHPAFRIFATSNTVGMGDTTGLYHGTQLINQGQMDRWNIVSTLNYLPPKEELKILIANVAEFKTKDKKQLANQMIALANLTRVGFSTGEVSSIMSPRTVISWAQNFLIFNDINRAFQMSFLNKCDVAERPIFAEFYQRCFAQETADSIAA